MADPIKTNVDIGDIIVYGYPTVFEHAKFTSAAAGTWNKGTVLAFDAANDEYIPLDEATDNEGSTILMEDITLAAANEEAFIRIPLKAVVNKDRIHVGDSTDEDPPVALTIAELRRNGINAVDIEQTSEISTA